MPASDRARWPARLSAGLVWFHRWLGIATCLIFALWFASGAVLLFKPFPSLGGTERAELAQPIDFEALRLGPSHALSRVEENASGLRLIQREGVPTYAISTEGSISAVSAVSGETLPLLNRDGVGAAEPAIEYDQWVVHNELDPFRPLFRIPLQDADGTVLYKSAVTGEFVQRTTFADRAWNWVGAVLHWVYFTPLRSSFTAWDQSVWWLSLVATLVAIAGTILGVLRTRTALKQRKPSLSFYRTKWMRWHHLLGLFAAAFILAWIISGWLSMDHGRLFSRGQPTKAQESAYQGQSIAEAVRDLDPGVLRDVGAASEVAFHVVGGEMVLTVARPAGEVVRLDESARPLDEDRLNRLIERGVTASWGAPVKIDRVAPSNMYALAEGWPEAVRRVVTAYGDRPDIYVDASNGQILTVMDESRAAYAWAYYALHTFNFPGLTTRPLLRQTLVLIPLLFGFAFSITGVMIGYRRLKKSR